MGRSLRDSKYETCFFIFSLCFLFGCLVGALLGSLFQQNNMLIEFTDFYSLGDSGFPLALLRFVRFHLLAIFLGSSVLGVILLPALTALRGYALSCTAATIISAYPDNGIIMAFIILGIPSLFSLPCYFILTGDAFFSSRRIYSLSRGNPSDTADKLVGRVILCLPFLLVGALIEMRLVPYLISLLT